MARRRKRGIEPQPDSPVVRPASIASKSTRAAEEHESSTEVLQPANEELETSNEELQSLNEEQTLRDCGERESLVLRTTFSAVWDYDLAGRTVAWDETYEKLYGPRLAGAKVAWKWWVERVHPDDRDRVVQSVRGALAEPRQDNWRAEYRFRKPDGNYAHVVDQACIVRDASGRARRIVGATLDVTAQKLAEQKSRVRQEQLQAILNTAFDAIVTFNQRGIVMEVNPATERMFGYSQDELVGEDVQRLMPDTDDDERDANWERYLQTGEARIIGSGRELAGRRKDGSTFPVELVVSQVEHLGLFTAIIRDISLRKELQRKVLAVASDEQRRIGQELHDGTGQELTGLALFAGTLANLLSEVPQRAPGDQGGWLLEDADLQRLRQTAKKLSEKLVEANRHVQQLSRGIMPVQIEAEGLRSALEELAAANTELPNFTCRFGCSQPIAVANNTTATHLYRIAQEAVNNAMRHSRADEIRIFLGQTQEEILLEVSDNGTGFDLATVRQASGSSSTRGFGLGIMGYRAGMIGGTLRVTRLDKGGTLVRCTVSRGGDLR